MLRELTKDEVVYVSGGSDLIDIDFDLANYSVSGTIDFGGGVSGGATVGFDLGDGFRVDSIMFTITVEF